MSVGLRCSCSRRAIRQRDPPGLRRLGDWQEPRLQERSSPMPARRNPMPVAALVVVFVAGIALARPVVTVRAGSAQASVSGAVAAPADPTSLPGGAAGSPAAALLGVAVTSSAPLVDGGDG